jgi:hypothetical protein
VAVPDKRIIAEWAAGGSQTKRIAAMLACELMAASEGDRVISSRKIAERFGASNTMAVKARYLLMGQGVIHKSGIHYYVGRQEGQAR